MLVQYSVTRFFRAVRREGAPTRTSSRRIRGSLRRLRERAPCRRRTQWPRAPSTCRTCCNERKDSRPRSVLSHPSSSRTSHGRHYSASGAARHAPKRPIPRAGVIRCVPYRRKPDHTARRTAAPRAKRRATTLLGCDPSAPLGRSAPIQPSPRLSKQLRVPSRLCFPLNYRWLPHLRLSP